MIRLGTALKSQEAPFHRCLVLSDPQTNGGMVVLVRVTTDDGTWSELDHDSTVAYSTCKFGPAARSLEAAIQRELFQIISDPPVAVLRRIIAAGHTAMGMPPRAKKFLAQI